MRRLYRSVTKKRYAKFPISLAWRASRLVNDAVRSIKPDVIFTMFPPPLVFYQGCTPCMYRLDTTFKGWETSYPEFGRPAIDLLIWEEKRALRKCARIITHSVWSRDILVAEYSVQSEMISVFPVPAAIPMNAVPASDEVLGGKRLDGELNLLLVGRDYHRKGVDLALEVVRILSEEMKCSSRLTVCGVSGEDSKNVRFVGPYRKGVSSELEEYVRLYRSAHFLLHPARFEAAGIVPSEAAAFGTPTITNDTGGLATTVKDGVSGVVLPKHSLAVAYAKAIRDIVESPERYYSLCRTTRERYERELNWDVAGKQVASILREAVSSRPSSSSRMS